MREVIVDVCMRKHLLNEWIIPYRRPLTFNFHSWFYYQHYRALTSVAVWSPLSTSNGVGFPNLPSISCQPDESALSFTGIEVLALLPIRPHPLINISS